MAQVNCSNNGCDGTFLEGDQFCGICGTPAPARDEAGLLNGGWDTELARADGYVPSPGAGLFFEHEPARPAAPLNNATRYLCAAAYLDRGFANEVISELVASRRAVAPSVSFDLGPVVRHCLRARKNILIRNIVLIIAVIAGFIINPLPAVDFLLITFFFGVLLPNAKWRSRGPLGKFLFAAAVVANVWVIATFSFALVLGSFVSALTAGGGSVTSALAHAVGIAFFLAALFAVTLGTQFAFTHAMFRTLWEHLRLGAPPPSASSSAAEDRIGMVERAQRGNITFYEGENPFIGMGAPMDKQWSIAIKLDPADPARQGLRARSAASGYVAIDPVELHGKIRERLLTLNDPGLPVNERITALSVTDRLVGPGLLRWASPLVDADRRTPYSHASPQAIEAVIRHPQAGVRYYQQVSVSDEGPPVTTGGRQVIEGVDHGIAVSALVYAAVEGRMFYLEFFLTALPPIKNRYSIIELLPSKSSPAFLGMTLWYSLKSVFSDIAYLPHEMYRAFRTRWRERRNERKALAADGSAAGALGTRVSVRELGSDSEIKSYIHALDAEKYKKIIERLLLETVQDFLAANGVDISAFKGSAHSVINGNVYQTGPISGSGIQIGDGNTVNQSAAPSVS